MQKLNYHLPFAVVLSLVPSVRRLRRLLFDAIRCVCVRARAGQPYPIEMLSKYEIRMYLFIYHLSKSAQHVHIQQAIARIERIIIKKIISSIYRRVCDTIHPYDWR